VRGAEARATPSDSLDFASFARTVSVAFPCLIADERLYEDACSIQEGITMLALIHLFELQDADKHSPTQRYCINPLQIYRVVCIMLVNVALFQTFRKTIQEHR